MIAVAGLGLVLNGGIMLALRSASRSDLNVRSAFVHMLGDAVSAYGEARLYEPYRYKTDDGGPGGFYAKWAAQMPDVVTATGEDALFGYVHFASGAIGHAIFHFAGHGEFDPAQPDSSVLYLSDGLPLSSILFRSAKYGGAHQPLLFLNACMIGIGGQLLGDMGGFPGNCLKGGFGGVLGALWEVDDVAARTIAIEFWKRAMGGEPIGAILRDVRAGYVTSGAAPP